MQNIRLCVVALVVCMCTSVVSGQSRVLADIGLMDNYGNSTSMPISESGELFTTSSPSSILAVRKVREPFLVKSSILLPDNKYDAFSFLGDSVITMIGFQKMRFVNIVTGEIYDYPVRGLIIPDYYGKHILVRRIDTINWYNPVKRELEYVVDNVSNVLVLRNGDLLVLQGDDLVGIDATTKSVRFRARLDGSLATNQYAALDTMRQLLYVSLYGGKINTYNYGSGSLVSQVSLPGDDIEVSASGNTLMRKNYDSVVLINASTLQVIKSIPFGSEVLRAILVDETTVMAVCLNAVFSRCNIQTDIRPVVCGLPWQFETIYLDASGTHIGANNYGVGTNDGVVVDLSDGTYRQFSGDLLQSADGSSFYRSIASGQTTNDYVVWKGSDLSELRRIPGRPVERTLIEIDLLKNRLLESYGDTTLLLTDLTTNEEILYTSSSLSRKMKARFVRDGNFVVLQSDYTALVLDANTGRPVAEGIHWGGLERLSPFSASVSSQGDICTGPGRPGNIANLPFDSIKEEPVLHVEDEYTLYGWTQGDNVGLLTHRGVYKEYDRNFNLLRAVVVADDSAKHTRGALSSASGKLVVIRPDARMLVYDVGVSTSVEDEPVSRKARMLFVQGTIAVVSGEVMDIVDVRGKSITSMFTLTPSSTGTSVHNRCEYDGVVFIECRDQIYGVIFY